MASFWREYETLIPVIFKEFLLEVCKQLKFMRYRIAGRPERTAIAKCKRVEFIREIYFEKSKGKVNLKY
jgi:hypothetical protein